MTTDVSVSPPRTAQSPYLIAWTLGNMLGLKMSVLQIRGNLRVQGRERAVAAIREGPVIIAANHPSLPDDFVIASVFWPNYLFDQRYFIWSMPDRRILQSFKMSEEKARSLRCILVDRTNPYISGRGVQQAEKVLRKRGVISIHCEDGRTNGVANKDKPLIELGDRVMRKVSDRVLKLSQETGAAILPTWIDMPSARDDVSVRTTFDRIRGKYGQQFLPVTISFGEAYRAVSSDEDARVELQKKIMSA